MHFFTDIHKSNLLGVSTRATHTYAKKGFSFYRSFGYYETVRLCLFQSFFAFLFSFQSRLLITHISDNHGKSDEHLSPGFGGNIDWPVILRAILFQNEEKHQLAPPLASPSSPISIPEGADIISSAIASALSSTCLAAPLAFLNLEVSPALFDAKDDVVVETLEQQWCIDTYRRISEIWYKVTEQANLDLSHSAVVVPTAEAPL
jgi:hypothetical protein